MNNGHDVQYFIDLFESIPAEQWCCHNFRVPGGIGEPDSCCVLGHLGVPDADELSPEAEDLIDWLRKLSLYGREIATVINDGNHRRFRQNHPKDRILAALYLLKARGW